MPTAVVKFKATLPNVTRRSEVASSLLFVGKCLFGLLRNKWIDDKNQNVFCLILNYFQIPTKSVQDLN